MSPECRLLREKDSSLEWALRQLYCPSFCQTDDDAIKHRVWLSTSDYAWLPTGRPVKSQRRALLPFSAWSGCREANFERSESTVTQSTNLEATRDRWQHSRRTRARLFLRQLRGSSRLPRVLTGGVVRVSLCDETRWEESGRCFSWVMLWYRGTS